MAVLHRANRIPVNLVAWATILFLIAPLLVIFPISLTPERYISMPDGQLSLRHYRAVFASGDWLAAALQSLVTGVGASVIATSIGGAASIGVWLLGGRIARGFRLLALLPLLVPPIVSALALSRIWVDLGLFDTQPGLMLAHAILGLPFVFMTTTAALEGLDPRLVQAARSLGAKPLRAVWEVVVPNVKSGLATGALFAFFISWDEIVVTLFVSARNVRTLPRQIWSGIHDNLDPAIAAVSVLMILITLVAAAVYMISQRSRINLGED